MKRCLVVICAVCSLAGCGNLLSRLQGPDAGSKDSGTADAGTAPDAGGVDAGGADAGGVDAGVDAGFDAGTNPGSDAGGGSDAGSDAGPPGCSTLGFPGFDGGPSSDGGPFTWNAVTVPVADRLYNAVSGTGATDVYVVGGNSASASTVIEHWDGMSFGSLYTDTALPGLNALWAAPSGAVLAGGDGAFVSCMSGSPTPCSTPGGGNFYRQDVAGFKVMGICGTASETAYAVGYNTGGTLPGWVWRWTPNNGSWTAVDQGTTGAGYSGCWISPDASLWVSGQGGIVHYPVGLSPPTVETPPGTDALFNWYSVTAQPDGLIVVGDEKVVALRDWSCNWTLPFGSFPTGVGGYKSVLALSSNEAFAAGTQTTGYTAARGFDGTWSREDDLPILIDVSGTWAADANTLFVVGQEKNSLGGVVGAGLVMGTR